MSTIRVQTAQNVSLEYEVASLGDRIVAALLDNFILIGWVVLCAGIFTALQLGENKIALVVLGVLIGIPYVFYNLICEVAFNGQSLGKKARDIKVIRLDGTQPSLGDYLLRWLLRLVDVSMFSGLIAMITIAANGRGQRLGDIAAGTTVIRLRQRPRPTPLSMPASYQVVFPQASLLADHDVALIRQLFQRALTQENYLLINELATKVKGLTGIQTDLPDDPFLRTVLRDHAYLTTQA